MEDVIERPVETKKHLINEHKSRKSVQIYSKSNRNSYNLKEQLENLTGSIDFTTKLDEINLIIGIIISAILLAYFIS
jgi:hypothetical protein